jgi:anti-sigma factor RsiW
MNCERFEKNLIPYLDGKASPSDRRQAQAHLASCDACRERTAQFLQLWSALDEVPAAEPSPAFDAIVRERVAREPRRTGWWAWLAPSPRMAIVVAALVMLSVWLNSRPPSDQQAGPMLPQSSEVEFRMIKNLPVLEDYDVLANFDALTELPVQQPAEPQPEM